MGSFAISKKTFPSTGDNLHTLRILMCICRCFPFQQKHIEVITVYMPINLCTKICVHIYICVYTCLHSLVWNHILCENMRVHTHIYIYIQMHSLTFMKWHIMRKHVYIYAFTHSYEITDYAETCVNHLYMYIGILALSWNHISCGNM